MEYPEVSIIILNWNGLGETIECLESIRNITYSSYKIIIVDNASEGDDVRILNDRFGDYVHVIENESNYGFSKGSNIGIQYAITNFHSEYLLLLNNDTVVHPDFLGEMVDVAVADPSIGIIGPKVYFYDSPETIWFAGGNINFWLGRMWHRGIGETDTGQFDDIVPVDFITGCCMMISRRTLETIGFLDQAFFFGAEDYDICIRASKHGFRVIYVPEAKIWHKVGKATGRTGKSPGPFAVYYVVKNHFILLEKHMNKLQYITATMWFSGLLPLLFILYVRHDRQWSTLKRFLLGFRDYLLRKW